MLTVILKTVSFLKQAKATLSGTESEAVKAFKKAIPESLYLQVEALTKKELGAIVNLGALLGAIVGVFNSLLAIFL